MDKWQNLPVPVYLDLYVFEFVNAEEVMKTPHIKPIVKERCPYVFRIRANNINMSTIEEIGRDAMMKLDYKDILFKTKNIILETLVFPVVTYGWESWTLRKEERK
ncbi:SCARB1 [Cordylochernes scorpioides]|uniref:SCARB1 n=1 Tax=Cordylochernes scorpioides TaxID=51811 RepID=A0ABY6KUV2_9ARAC|nr:SCARB1 [Cordylochernes scorpioides]